jgi:transglutaminase-like putative cysteine protease
LKFRIHHVNRYLYAEPVSLCHSIAHLKPREQRGQRTHAAHVRVDPWPAVSREHHDFFGNRQSYFSIQQTHTALEVTATSELTVEPPPLPALDRSLPWERVVAALQEDRDEDDLAARIFTLPSAFIPVSPAAADYARTSFTPRRPLLEAVADLMGRIYREFEYDPHFTTIATPLADVIAHRKGVCQDFAHLAIASLRGLGLAARYVSGYLETLPPPGKPKLQGADASHAWFSVYVPGAGWVDFDPTNDQIPREQHITTAVGRDYRDVTPLRGVFYGGGEHTLEVAVDVDRVGEPDTKCSGTAAKAVRAHGSVAASDVPGSAGAESSARP